MLRTAIKILLVFIVLTLGDAPVFAWDQLDVEAELRRPGVKLLVVEFFADWCEPCKAAIPSWNRLHKKYRDRGLRLIVVSVGDAGSCSSPGWQPDKMVCDFDGSIQERFGAHRLPQAFLYSWQGHRLASHAKFDQIEPLVKRYFKKTPRILISDAIDQDGKKVRNAGALKEMARTELSRLAKFDLLAGDRDMRELRKIRKKGHKAKYNEEDQCVLGKEVSANSELKTKLLTFGNKQTLVLQLYSVEDGCMTGSAKARVGERGLDAAMVEAVAALVDALIGRPTGAKASISNEVVSGGENVEEYVPPTGEDVIIGIKSDPPGAKVKVKGITVCPQTPCEGVELRDGMTVFEFSKDRHESAQQSVSVRSGMRPIYAELKPLFGWFSASSEPADVEVVLDGEKIGVTPVTKFEVDPGRHKVEIGNDVYAVQWQEFSLTQGQHKEVSFALKARQGGLKVKAQTKDGQPIRGKVFIDDEELGNTGKFYAVNIGEHEVEVKTTKGSGNDTVKVLEGETRIVIVQLTKEGNVQIINNSDSSHEALGLEWVSIPGGSFNMGSDTGDDDEKPVHRVTVSSFEMMKTEVKVEHFKICVASGKCKKKNFETKGESMYCNFGHKVFFKIGKLSLGDRDDHPMNCVNWRGAKEFCSWVGGRLPTEKEWEYVASGGEGRTYPWGETPSPSCDVAIMNDGGNGCRKVKTWPVCSKPDGNSKHGLCDLAGNVWEWTEDCYSKNYTSEKDCSNRVLRGGCWVDDAKYVRASNRVGSDPSDRDNSNGFRCSRDVN